MYSSLGESRCGTVISQLREMVRRLKRESRMRKETERPEPIIRRNDHHTVTREAFAVVVRHAGRDFPQIYSLRPEYTPPQGCASGWATPVSRHSGRGSPIWKSAPCLVGKSCGRLRTDNVERRRVTHARPRFYGNRLAPAKITDGRLRVRDAREDGTAFVEQCSSDLSAWLLWRPGPNPPAHSL
jgi:hypothetical protein